MYFLGMDGGGSGCRAVLSDASGRVLGRGTAGPSNVFSDPNGALVNVLSAAQKAMGGICSSDEVVAVLGLAGANVAGDGIAANLPFARVRVLGDIETAVAGALGDADGIVVALGTGSVFARQRAGEVRAIGGWGLTLGDEGSGAWMGRALCARALKAVDGFFEMSPLLAGLVTEIGSAAAIVRFAARATPADFAALAPRVLGADDPAAAALMAEAASAVSAAIALLQPSDGALPVVYLGGLGSIFAARLGAHWPQRAPLGDGLSGALWLALRDA
ncbi:MAG: ATPase [Alphaproteobacteria bacterium HGW-Alphaproteobacteria-4]|nr:MAG: ATPase [Alphaproteobacteria bacterium HGW-Alphaproteobacteria-4]